MLNPLRNRYYMDLIFRFLESKVEEKDKEEQKDQEEKGKKCDEEIEGWQSDGKGRSTK